MVYTTEELKKILSEQTAQQIAAGSGIHLTTIWRLWTGRQEARESTLAKLTEYVEGGCGGILQRD